MEKCFFCNQGVLVDKKVTVDFRWGKNLVIIEDVPAKVCNECGERYYSANVSRMMEEIAMRRKVDRYVEVPLFRLPSAATATM
jgi:YgiT-type zinc finger domain-containing protein